VALLTKLGADDFGEMGRRLYETEGISSDHLLTHLEVANATELLGR